MKKADNRYAPLQIVHDFKFTALNVKDDYSVLESAEYKDKLEHIKGRLDRLNSLGYGGVVMNVDYSGYLKSPDAFTLFFDSLEYAKSLGMKVWIYDEQYYPSGSAGGLTLLGHPELEALGLACVSENFKIDDTVGAIRVASPKGYSELKYAVIAPIVNGEIDHSQRRTVSHFKDLGGGLCYDAPVGEWRVWCFFLRPLYELTKFCQGTRASRRYISIFNKKAVERFYKVTFEDGYIAHSKNGLEGLVEAVFTDEPYSPCYHQYRHDYGKTLRTTFSSSAIYDKPHRDMEIYPYLPWEMTLEERYFERYGTSVVDTLPDLFDETPKTKEARYNLFSLLSDMSKEAFAEQFKEKLGKEKVIFSGHYYGEEFFDLHPVFFGDILDHLGVMGIPGCDCLWSDLDILRYYVPCKLASSAAHLNNLDEVMIEASNMVDKDQSITLQRLKAAMSTMLVHGINRITSYYSEKLLPDEEMKAFAEHVRSLNALLDKSKYRVNTLLYYPFENLCRDRTLMGIDEEKYSGEDHLGIAETAKKLLQHQVQFDFINKRKLLSTKIKKDALIAPNGERIKYVVLPDLNWLDPDVAKHLKNAKNAGVKIIFSGDKREICNVEFTKHYLNDENYPDSDLKITNEQPYILASHRAFDESDLFMLVNTASEDLTAEISVKLKSDDALYLVDQMSGNGRPIDYAPTEGTASLTVKLPAFETVIIGRSKGV